MKLTAYTYPTPLSAALLADIHNRPFDEALTLVRELKPDIIAIAGDIINGHHPDPDEPVVLQQENVLPFLKACARLAPTFLSFGNHEWMLGKEDENLIRTTGVTVLDNSFVEYNGVVIGGLSSARKTRYAHFKQSLGDYEGLYPPFEEPHPTKERLDDEPATDWLDDFEKMPGYKLLLSHHPEYRDLYLSDRNIDLILSGHCHGGQIRLFDRGLFAPGQGWLPKYTKGIYDNMIVTTGLANTGGVVPRLFNPREVVYISSRHKFVPAEKQAAAHKELQPRVACEYVNSNST